MTLRKKYTVHWKDFNSPLARNELMPHWGLLWNTEYDLPSLHFGIISRKNTIDYFVDLKALHAAQKVLYGRMMKDPSRIEELIWRSEDYAHELNSCTEKIYRTDLSRWSVDRLEKAYKTFFELQKRQYGIGTLLVGLDTAAGPFSLDRALRDLFVLKGFEGKRLEQCFAAFTAPAYETYSRRQEKDLLKIYAVLARHPKLLKEFARHSSDRLAEFLRENLPAVLRRIKNHTAKWAWVYYTFAGPEWSENDFCAVMKDWAKRRVKPDVLAVRWRVERDAITKQQKKYRVRMSLTQAERALLRLGGLQVWAKPHRKDHQSKSYWHMEYFFREIAHRLGISLRQARSMPHEMIFGVLRGEKLNIKKINEFYDFHLTTVDERGVRILSRKRAREFIRKHVLEKKVTVKGNEFRGSSACSGKVSGCVKIINSPDEMEKMEEGDILVSVATNPSIVPAMRKASAILTDEGGLTCHAAIVSRELNIPCVVGLHVITSAVKDGDLVEVDATKGIVKLT